MSCWLIAAAWDNVGPAGSQRITDHGAGTGEAVRPSASRVRDSSPPWLGTPNRTPELLTHHKLSRRAESGSTPVTCTKFAASAPR